MNKLIFIFFLFTFIHQEAESQSNPLLSPTDSLVLNYGEEDYERMRTILKEDTILINNLDQKIAEGDTNAVILKKIIFTPYESRLTIHPQITDGDIHVTVYAAYASHQIMERFRELDESLDSYYSDTLHIQTDSLIQEMEHLRKELKRE